jgi:hypothetical protein
VALVFKLAGVFFGEAWIKTLAMDRPVLGELIGGLVGLVPNCAASVLCAQMYAAGMISGGALMASSFTGCGVGMLVLFRQNRDWKVNLAVLAVVYATGCLLGFATGGLL